jgi:hypothetical protein
MNSLSLVRDFVGLEQIKGQLFVLNDIADIVFQCFTLELPWKNNANYVSCIPEGRYRVKKRWSKKYKNHFHILNVPGRDYILIHEANYVFQLLGCIAVGDRRVDINGDGLKDVTNSIRTKMKLISFLPDEFELVISSLKS